MEIIATEIAFAIFNFIFFLALFVGIPVLIGVYVYRDARTRGMNAPLWTLVAILAPMLIGFIVYLLVRGSYSDLKCPRCETRVKEEYTACPKCGAKLRATCASCSLPLEADWSVCPRCTVPVTEIDPNVTPPLKRRDRTLGKVLIAIILIPVLLILLSMFFLIAFSPYSQSASVGASEWTTASYKNNPQVSAWIKQCDRNSEGVYVLRSQDKRGESNFTRFLIYRPGATQTADVNANLKDGLFKMKMSAEFTSTGTPQTEGAITSIVYTGNQALKDITVTVDGKKANIRIKDIDLQLSLTSAI